MVQLHLGYTTLHHTWWYSYITGGVVYTMRGVIYATLFNGCRTRNAIRLNYTFVRASW
jgi:hypothetical protein